MQRKLKLKKGCQVDLAEKLYEGYEINDGYITANIGTDKIEDVMQHFVVMHKDEPLFFILELPANLEDETEIAPGILRDSHKDVYYIDNCSADEALVIMMRAGQRLFNDGLVRFGYGGHESGDEIMFRKYNILTISSKNIEAYADYFEPHKIPQVEKIVTAWDIISDEHPGSCEVYEVGGKTVYDIPDEFKEWGIYLAEQREEV